MSENLPPKLDYNSSAQKSRQHWAAALFDLFLNVTIGFVLVVVAVVIVLSITQGPPHPTAALIVGCFIVIGVAAFVIKLARH